MDPCEQWSHVLIPGHVTLSMDAAKSVRNENTVCDQIFMTVLSKQNQNESRVKRDKCGQCGFGVSFVFVQRMQLSCCEGPSRHFLLSVGCLGKMENEYTPPTFFDWDQCCASWLAGLASSHFDGLEMACQICCGTQTCAPFVYSRADR